MGKEPNIVHHKFSEDQYYHDITEKNQIVLHHTVSGQSTSGDINWWESTPDRVATCVIIARDGTIHTLFSSKKWAHHLGIKSWVFKKFNLKSYGANKKLNQNSIGVELDSWGGLVKRGSKYYSVFNNEIKSENVVDFGIEIRGYRYYEKYTDQQIESLEYLLKYWSKEYNIPIIYNSEMWNLNENALKGESGIWSHTSYRPDKSDVSPQENLIKMLKRL